MRVLAAMILATLAACSAQSDAEATTENLGPTSAADTATPFPVVPTASGRYRVEIDPKLNPKTLPQNADLKMLDGDLTQYALQLCGLDFANKLRPDRCEVFVQLDPSSLLTGYAVLTQGQNVSIDTAIETDRQKGGLGCFVKGELESSDLGRPKSKLNIGRNFEARLMYNAWEKSPGDWMVGPVSDDASEGAIGVWYVKRLNNKLRISQERWSYCYKGSEIYIDEVFDRGLTLTRVGN